METFESYRLSFFIRILMLILWFTSNFSAFRPRISVITSIYNCDLFIKHFMREIVKQTIFHQCELILINANSPGKEEAIILPYVKAYPHNIVYKKLSHDPGLYGVWNRGIEHARSYIITMINTDDGVSYNFLAVHSQALLADAHLECVFSSVTITQKPNQLFPTHDYLYICDKVNFTVKPGIIIETPPTRAVWKKSIFRKYGLFKENFKIYGDVEFWARSITQGLNAQRIKGVYGYFYLNPRGLSNGNNNKPHHEREMQMFRNIYNHLTRSYYLP